LEIKKILERPIAVSTGNTTISFPQQSSEQNADEIKEIEDKTKDEVDEIIKNLKKKESEISNKDEQIFKLTIEKHFEYTYRLIFLSQIQLLQNLQTMSDGFSQIQLEEYFQNVQKSFIVFSSWNSNIYLKFLYDQNLVIKDNITGKTKITTIGELFLNYLIISRYNILSEKNL
jgi:arsenate reductase-like glutaredoxin family protein